MPLCLGADDSRPRQQHPSKNYCAPKWSDLLTSDAPATVDPGLGCQALGRSRAQLRRSSWHQKMSPRNVGGGRRAALIVGSERDDRRHDPRRDGNLRPLTRPAVNSWAMMICSTGWRLTHGLGEYGAPTHLRRSRQCAAHRHRLQRGTTSARIWARNFSVRVQVDVYGRIPASSRCPPPAADTPSTAKHAASINARRW